MSLNGQTNIIVEVRNYLSTVETQADEMVSNLRRLRNLTEREEATVYTLFLRQAVEHLYQQMQKEEA